MWLKANWILFYTCVLLSNKNAYKYYRVKIPRELAINDAEIGTNLL